MSTITLNKLEEEFNKRKGDQSPLTLRETTLLSVIAEVMDSKEVSMLLSLSNTMQEALKDK